jgi:regulator of replication initiation timing
MPFSVSIGDGIAIAKLIVDITKSLQDIGGAKSDYQELIRELETLQKALTHLDSLQSTAPNSKIYDSIKFAALSCRQPLEEFLRKVQKYENSLGLWRAGSAAKAAKDKLQWTFSHKDAVDKLQKYLDVHVGTINMMLAEYGLESMTVATNKANMDNLHIQERLENTRTLVERLGTSVQGQTLIIQNTESLVTRLFNIVSGELKASWQSLFDMVAKVW